MSLHRRLLLGQASASALILCLLGKSAHAETATYTYDSLGRLTSVTYQNGATVAYGYDASGNRTLVSQTTGSTAPTGTFAPSPSSIAQGASSTLSWTSADATSAAIDNGVGTVTPVASGSVQVSPASTTTYTLTLNGPGGQTTKQATVTVNAPPSGAFSANPASIASGATATLSWTSSGATSANIDNGVGPVTPVASGSVQVSPTSTTTYTMTLTGPGGQTTKQATVTVTPGGFNQTIQVTGSGPVNLRTLANSAGYNGAENATVVFQVGSGVTVMGAAGSTSAAGGLAIDTGTWPSGSYTISLSLEVSGKIYGGGGGGGKGAGGTNGSIGTAGGDAVYCQENLSVLVNAGGEIKAGGGGGGGGGGRTSAMYEFDRCGGGGGGGFPNGQGGTPGEPVFDGSTNAANGSGGTTSGGGAGGAGETSGGGAGGAGGGAGVNGSSGVAGSGTGTVKSPGAGGAAGYAIRKNGKTVSVTNNGTIVGTQA